MLTLFGFYKEQSPAPNQEIELHFTDSASTSQETTAIIQAITEQLEALGVENIQVRPQEGASLKIAYFSKEKVAAVKELLIENGFSAKDTLPVLPVEETNVYLQSFANVDQYQIDIYELQAASDAFLGAHGKFILDLHKEFDKSPTPNLFANTNSFVTGDHQTIAIELTYTRSEYTVIPKENISYEIPDVRAGPFTTSLS
ncbi:MAG: hypothetical protein AAF617_01385 [Bacteroidota bacterium]